MINRIKAELNVFQRVITPTTAIERPSELRGNLVAADGMMLVESIELVLWKLHIYPRVQCSAMFCNVSCPGHRILDRMH
jgi:hypothetical protein